MRGGCVFRIKIGEDAGVFRSKKKFLNKIMVQNGKIDYLGYSLLACKHFSPRTISRQCIATSFFVYNFICLKNDATMYW